MPKRKDQSDSDSDVSLIDVDFEFFDPHPDIDYIALKRLFTQLFQSDSELLQVHDLVNLVLGQPLVGTTVKIDGKESDPYAVLTVLNLGVHKENPSIKALTEYALKKASSSSSVHTALQNILSSPHQVGLVLSERLINMPPQIIPPMYRMLQDEIKWALEDNEPYTFTHYLFISRTYRLSPSDESAMEGVEMTAHPSKKAKKKIAPVPTSFNRNGPSIYPFHPEDEQIQKFASHSIDYDFTHTQPREQDSFGLDVAARIMLLPAEQLPALIEAIEEAYPPPATGRLKS